MSPDVNERRENDADGEKPRGGGKQKCRRVGFEDLAPQGWVFTK